MEVSLRRESFYQMAMVQEQQAAIYTSTSSRNSGRQQTLLAEIGTSMLGQNE
jgi:hypothetical protein